MRRFLSTLVIAAVALSALVVMVCVVVDPYGMVGSPRIQGFNADKPAAAARPRLSKPYQIDLVEPRTVLSGSSITDVGLDPESRWWPAALRPVFNLGIGGADPAFQATMLAHAMTRDRPPGLVVIMLAFEDAVVISNTPGPREPTIDGDQGRLRSLPDWSPNPHRVSSMLRDYVFATFSLQALKDSVVTVLHQNSDLQNYSTALGHNTAGAMRQWTMQEGANTLFIDKGVEKGRLAIRWKAAPVYLVEPLRTMIEQSLRRGAKVIVVIPPVHVEMMEIQRQLGLGGFVESWMRDVVAIVEQSGAGADIPVWDFRSYSQYTTEAVPPPGDRVSAPHWFWEPIHFQERLGELIIEKIMRGTGPDDFGVRITSANLEAHLVAVRQGADAWVASHAGAVAESRDVLRRAGMP